MRTNILFFSILLSSLFMNCWNDYDKMMAKENGKCRRQKQEETACRVLVFSDCISSLGHSACSSGYFFYEAMCEKTSADCKGVK